MADDAALVVNMLALRRHDSRRQVAVGIRQSDAVKHNLEVTLADEVSWLLLRFDVPGQIGAARKCHAAELCKLTEVAEHRIAHLRGFWGKVRIIRGAVQQSSSGYQCRLGLCNGLHTHQ